MVGTIKLPSGVVSTHSRLKAAGALSGATGHRAGFNTQPPEGGWEAVCHPNAVRAGFNTQPPEGGWESLATHAAGLRMFQHTAA